MTLYTYEVVLHYYKGVFPEHEWEWGIHIPIPGVFSGQSPEVYVQALKIVEADVEKRAEGDWTMLQEWDTKRVEVPTLKIPQTYSHVRIKNKKEQVDALVSIKYEDEGIVVDVHNKKGEVVGTTYLFWNELI